jgi:3'(2'), 5'-bisphosphate nucleotidase
MRPDPFAALADQALGIALRAGESIAYHYAKGGGSQIKLDGSPVTEADRASEAVILFGLEAIAPDIPILSEEQVAAGHVPDLSGGVYWCVDPLDGTKEYLKRTGEFTVCIGGVVDSLPIFGILHAPLLELTYLGIAGQGAWRIGKDGARQPIAARTPRESGLTALVSRSHRDGAQLDAFLASHNVTEHMSMGSAAKFGLIAEGRADLYARFGPTSEWDTAAGQAVLEAAGGSVTDLDGNRLRCGREKFLNAGFIARGRS